MDPNTAVLTAVAAPNVFFDTLLSIGSIALGGVTWALVHLGLWAGARIKNEKIRAIWLRADDYAVRAVKDVFQAYVDPLKKAGKWNDESAATAKRMAVEKVKEMLSWQHGVQALSYIFSGSEKSLDEFVGTFVESAVLDVNRETETVHSLAAPTAPSVPAPAAPFPAARADGSRPINPTPAPVVP